MTGASQASYTGTQTEHSSVLGCAGYVYLNWWQAISGCHAIAFHIILSSPNPHPSTPLALSQSSPLSISCLSVSPPLFCSPPSPSSTSPPSLSLTLPVSFQLFQGDLLALVYLVWIPTCVMGILWCLMPAVREVYRPNSASDTHLHAHAILRYCVDFKHYREYLQSFH